jgi:hypothetical protein
MSETGLERPVAFGRGPYLQMAVICERVLQEQDGVLSVIRVVDRLIQSAIGPGVSEQMAPFPVNLTGLIVLKAGEARGRYRVTVTLELPSGQQAPAQIELPVLLEGEDRGVNLVIQLGFQAEQEGLYWFNVDFEGTQLTRMPLRVVYQPQRVGGTP